jgi:hypothetical protein
MHAGYRAECETSGLGSSENINDCRHEGARSIRLFPAEKFFAVAVESG